jgi:ectoine hydroxylase-related dioxygenase (phytanoyl-CoA dioxygenase family)
MDSALWTSWIPLGDYNVSDGVLAVCEGSHEIVSTSSRSHPSELPAEFSTTSDSSVWRTGAVRAGDVLLFDIRTIHASTPNFSSQFRLSVDMRWMVRDSFAAV